MRLSLQLKGTLLGTGAALLALGVACAAGEIFRSAPARPGNTPAQPPAPTQATQGQKLFAMNCAHCHGADARGDEGPDLHGITKSDAHIAAIIKKGVPGEMPKFATKLSDPDVQALTAFLRGLKE
jgi:cytochrome c oxidase cbb3-type subunit 3